MAVFTKRLDRSQYLDRHAAMQETKQATRKKPNFRCDMVNSIPSYSKFGKLLLIVLVTLSTRPSDAEIFGNDVGVMLPKVKQRIMRAGDTNFIRCIFLRPSVKDENSIEWTLPEVFQHREDVGELF